MELALEVSSEGLILEGLDSVEKFLLFNGANKQDSNLLIFYLKQLLST
jgi:hypothetical protein